MRMLGQHEKECCCLRKQEVPLIIECCLYKWRQWLFFSLCFLHGNWFAIWMLNMTVQLSGSLVFCMLYWDIHLIYSFRRKYFWNFPDLKCLMKINFLKKKVNALLLFLDNIRGKTYSVYLCGVVCMPIEILWEIWCWSDCLKMKLARSPCGRSAFECSAYFS